MIQKDKKLHFYVNVIASILSIIAYEICPVLLIVGFPIGLSLGKEYGDSKAIGNKWDWFDIVADFIGLCLPLVIYTIIKVLL